MNLHLEVLHQREDGYHEIETILQAVDLHDRLRMILRDRWTDREPEVELLVRPVGSAPDDATNLVVRAEIADHLCVAAAQLGETEAQRAGRWEAFRAQPNLSRLLDLRDGLI